MYFESELATRLSAGGGKPACDVDNMMINITTWFLAVFPPAFSPIEDARRLTRCLQSSGARPAIFTPLITRFFESVSDDEVPWDMLSQLHSFASALDSNGMYELELSMVKQIREEFQSVFGVTLGYEPEYKQIMGDLQESIRNAEVAILAAGPRNTRSSLSKLVSPSVTPLIRRRRYLPPPQSSLRPSTRAHKRNSSPSPYRSPSRSQSPPPSSPVSTRSKSRMTTPPTPKRQNVPPPPKFPRPSPPSPISHTPLPKKRKRLTMFIELTPWVVKKRRMLAQGQLHTPKNPRSSFGNHIHSPLLDIRERLRTHVPLYPHDRPIRVVDKERHSSADTASSCSPTSSRTMLIASRRYNRATSPSPIPSDEDVQASEASEESGDSEEEPGSDHDEEGEDDSAEMSIVLPTSDDPLNLFALPDSSPRLARNKPRLRPLRRSRPALSP